MVFIGPFPNPIHGQSLATKNLYDFLESEKLDIKVINVSGSFLRKIYMHIYAFILILFSKKTSIYISLNSNQGLILNLALVLAARLKKSKLFLHYHAYDHIRRKTSVLKLLAQLSGNQALHIVLGQAMEKDLKICVGEHIRVMILNNSKLIQQKYDIRKNLNNSIIRLGHLSNLTKEKGLITTIDTAIFLNNYLNIELHLAGPAHSDEIQKEIKRAKQALGDSFIYVGAIYGEEKDNFYKNIDFFIFPSQYKNEAEPLVVLESLAAGIPVIASDIGCISGDLSSQGGVVFNVDENFNQLTFNYLNDIYLNNSYEKKSLNAREQFLNLLNESDSQLKYLLHSIKEGEYK